MKRFMLIALLTCGMPVSAMAGDMPSGDAPQLPPAAAYRPATAVSEVQVTTVDQVTQPESDQASLDPMQSLLLTILSLLAR